jgi:hypothetical protein
MTQKIQQKRRIRRPIELVPPLIAPLNTKKYTGNHPFSATC